MQGPLKSSGTANRRYPLSRDFIGSIQKPPVGPILVVGSRKAVKPPEAQHHRNTTFVGQQKTVEEHRGGRRPPELTVLQDAQKQFMQSRKAR